MGFYTAEIDKATTRHAVLTVVLGALLMFVLMLGILARIGLFSAEGVVAALTIVGGCSAVAALFAFLRYRPTRHLFARAAHSPRFTLVHLMASVAGLFLGSVLVGYLAWMLIWSLFNHANLATLRQEWGLFLPAFFICSAPWLVTSVLAVVLIKRPQPQPAAHA